ncbi:MAG: hypothetical protein NVS4B12_16030 [Ktedonobacteraceae bacterium]
MFGFDAQHTHFNPYEQILSATNVSELVLDWTTTWGESIDSGSPMIDNNIAYVGGTSYVVGPTNLSNLTQQLYAINAKTGTMLWSSSPWYIMSYISWPAIADGIAYACLSAQVGSGPIVSGDAGSLVALNAKTGATLWTADIDDSFDCDPTIADGIVYVISNNDLHAFNAKTGTVQRTVLIDDFITSSDPQIPARGSPAVANGVVYVGSGNHKLYAIDANKGTMLWSFTTGDAVFSSPAVANGVVYVSSWDDKLYAFHLLGLP